MSNALLDRLDRSVGLLLERNHQLKHECLQLRQEKAAWQQERRELLAEVEQILQKVDRLQLEDE